MGYVHEELVVYYLVLIAVELCENGSQFISCFWFSDGDKLHTGTSLTPPRQSASYFYFVHIFFYSQKDVNGGHGCPPFSRSSLSP
jgi:hypothetical protein